MDNDSYCWKRVFVFLYILAALHCGYLKGKGWDARSVSC